MAHEFHNRVMFTAVSSGTGAFVVSVAVTGYRTPATASLTDGATVSYTAESSDKTEWETGLGTYTSGTTSLARTTVRESSNGGSAVNFTAAPNVWVDFHAQDEANLVETSRTLTAGAGLTGGGTLAADRTFTVGAGTGITVNADDVALDTSSTRNTDHAGVTLTAGTGLTGGGDISASRTFDVGAGTGITVNANDVQLNLSHAANALHPATSTDNAIARYDGTAGALQDTGIFIDDNNTLLQFVTSPVSLGGFSSWFQTVATNSRWGWSQVQYGATAGELGTAYGKTRGTSGTDHVILNNNDIITGFAFHGSDGTGYSGGGEFLVEVDATPGVGNMPIRYKFMSTEDGAGFQDQRLRISNNGSVQIGNKNATGSRRLHVFHQVAATDAVLPTVRLTTASLNAPAIGIGTAIEFEAETAADNYEVGAVIEAVTTNVTSTTEAFDLVIKTMTAGATAAEALRITSAKEVRPAARITDPTITLTDGANVTLNAALGNTFKVVAAGNRTIDAPTNAPATGRTQRIVIAHEASGAARTLALATGAGAFRFGTDITGLTATSDGLVDYIGAVWNESDSRWDIVSYVKGF